MKNKCVAHSLLSESFQQQIFTKNKFMKLIYNFQIRKLISRVLTRDVFNYRKITDKPLCDLKKTSTLEQDVIITDVTETKGGGEKTVKANDVYTISRGKIKQLRKASI